MNRENEFGYSERYDRVRAIQASYDASCLTYDSLYFEEQSSKLSFLKDLDLTVNGAILDIGCGTGISMQWMGAGVIVGVDISQGMLGIASKKDFEVVQADMCSLPFRDEAFCVDTFFTSLHHALDTRTALTEAVRTLKADGLLVLSLLKASDWISSIHSLNSMSEVCAIHMSDTGKDYLVIMKRQKESLFQVA
jgi:ubiquinone/menaquinone biosynthesis C-methylase UbiE